MRMVIIKEILKDRSYPDGGTVLFGYIKEAISANELLYIDMTEADAIPTMFMNTSFGNSIDKYGIEKTKATLKFKNISKSQIERFRKYFIDYENMINAHKDFFVD